MNHQAKPCYEFGPFRLDVTEHVLLRQGHPVPLTPKVFEVLRVLVQNSGRLVEKEELLKEIWPDSFVEEANLNRSVSVLRKALGEDPSGYIQTVPKRGYRFVAQVTARPQERPELFVEERTYSRIEVQQEEEIETDNPRMGPLPDTLVALPSRVRISRRMAAVAGSVVLILGIPVVGNLLADRMPALSPDGTMVAFFQPEAGPMGDFWILPVTGGGARRITFDVAQGSSPAWTPDGRFVLFSSKRAGSMTLWKVPVSGGSVEPLLVSPGEDTDPEISRDGSKLIYTHVRHTFVLTVLDTVSRQTRELRKTREILAGPLFSPNGEKLSFFSHQSDGDVHLYTIGSDGSDLQRLTWAKGERNTFPRWSADGAFLYFNQSRPEPSLRKLLLSGGPSSALVSGWTWETHRYAHIDSSNGSIVCTRMDDNLPVSTIIRDIKSGREVSLGRVLLNPPMV